MCPELETKLEVRLRKDYGQMLNTEFNFFKLEESMHSHNTRSASNIFIDYRRTNYGKFSLKYTGAQIWNNLPKELKT